MPSLLLPSGSSGASEHESPFPAAAVTKTRAKYENLNQRPLTHEEYFTYMKRKISLVATHSRVETLPGKYIVYSLTV